MARTAVTPIVMPGSRVTALSQLTFTAGDTGNGNKAQINRGALAIFLNTDASPHNVTVRSVADAQGRSGDITKSLGAGEYWFFGPNDLDGWQQSDGALYWDPADTHVQAAVLNR